MTNYAVLRKITGFLTVGVLILLPKHINAQSLNTYADAPARFCDSPPPLSKGNVAPGLPTALQAELQPGTNASIQFGYAVALSADGNTAIAGAPIETVNGVANAGAVYIYTRSGLTWTQQAQLTAPDFAASDKFGISVALSGDGNTALVGAQYKDETGKPNSGAAYFFARSGATWQFQEQVWASDSASGAYFGHAVALSGDGNTALIGANLQDETPLRNNGAAYVFVRAGFGWAQQEKLLTSFRVAYEGFGYAVALSNDGNTALIGTLDETYSTHRPAAYGFTRSGSTWTEQAQLMPNGTHLTFGRAVALSGDGSLALIGANGSVVPYTHNGLSWTQQADLPPSGLLLYTFGYAVAISADGTTALVGAPDLDPCNPPGEALLYTRTGSTWTYLTNLNKGRYGANADGGFAVALSADGETGLVGVPYQNSRGSAFVYSAPEFAPTATPTIVVTPSATPTTTPIPPLADTVGVYGNGVFYLRYSNTPGNPDLVSYFGGDPSDLPVVGDWNGDGVDTIGVYRSASGFFFLSDTNVAPTANYSFLFGDPGDTPFAGRWTADMVGSGVGVYRNSNGILYQRKSLTSGFDDFFAVFGNPADQAIAGDWDGNGLDSIGIYRSSTGMWYLSNNSTPAGITFSDINFMWSHGNNYTPVAGDWNGDGITTVGQFTDVNLFILHQSNTFSTAGDYSVYLGVAGNMPVAGRWIARNTQPMANQILHPNTSVPGNGSNVGGGDSPD